MPKKEDKQIATIAQYKLVFTSENGQKVLHDLMKTHFMISSTFDPKSSHVTAQREGERSSLISTGQSPAPMV